MSLVTLGFRRKASRTLGRSCLTTPEPQKSRLFLFWRTRFMNEQSTAKPTPAAKPKRIRKRKLSVQLESALRDAEAAATVDISTQKLISTRLNILSRAVAR